MITCNFCLHPVPKEKLAVAGPQHNAHICEDCVDMCRLVIEKEKKDRECPT